MLVPIWQGSGAPPGIMGCGPCLSPWPPAPASLSPKAPANVSHFFHHEEGTQPPSFPRAPPLSRAHSPLPSLLPSPCSTSLQGQEEVSVALQLLHELLVLQEERDPLVLQVLLPAALLVPGPGPGRGGQAALSVHGLGAPGVALRRGASMLNAQSQGHTSINSRAHLGGHLSAPRTFQPHPGTRTSSQDPVTGPDPLHGPQSPLLRKWRGLSNNVSSPGRPMPGSTP